ncbi:unnamed protein product [Echinostoma caproni]|uniref:DUF1758 domain-containing protein n=1 Tax=Echinostoma caproni TaxID=27848 RepID=A0A183B7G0_9TREM|nr:unnamed protein product [Echinostoma caproni]
MVLIDNGSDSTLITKRFAINLNITTRPSSLTISTVKSTKVTSAYQANVMLVSLDNDEREEVTEAFAIADLPMRAVESIRELAALWPHLRDLCFEEIDSPEVDLLIGYDVPEAYWVLYQRLGGRKEPYGARTMFGWTLFVPLHTTNRKPLSVNFTTTTAGNYTIEQALQRMYDNEFDDLNDQKEGPLRRRQPDVSNSPNRDVVPARPVRGAVAMKDGIRPFAEQSRDSLKRVRVL